MVNQNLKVQPWRLPNPETRPTAPRGSAAFGMQLWNKDNPLSLVSKLPESIKEHLARAYQNHAEWFEMSDYDLQKALKDKNLTLTVLDNRLRIALWMEYDQAVAGNRLIQPWAVYKGLCTEEIFNRVLSQDHKVVWIFTPPAKYEILLEEGLNYGLEQLRLILELPLFEKDKRGNDRLNINLAKLKMAITQMLDQRYHGAYIQKIEQKNLNVVATGEELFKMTSMEDLNKKIQEVEMELQKARTGNALQHKPDIVVTPEPVPVKRGKA